MKSRVALLVLLLSSSATLAAEGDAASYRLGPQDRLTIRVYDFRKQAGEAYPWPALTGEFAVNPDGRVSMPVLGQVQAAGGTTADLALRIAETLKQRVDLAELPEASVEVFKFRPFYVMGAVQRPGKFEYQPGLTVLQAVSTAEGLGRSGSLSATRRDLTIGRGDVRTLDAERLSLEAQQARLAAEIDERDSVTFPPRLVALQSDPRVARAMREETLLFQSRRNALRAELAAIDQSKVILREELVSLDAKGKSLDHEIDSNKQQLKVLTDLLNKGMTDKPRQLAAEQIEATFEASRLDVDVTSLKAREDLSRADRDVIEIKAKFRKDALDLAAETRTKLDVGAEKTRVAQMLVRQAEEDAPGTGDDDDPAPRFQLTHIGPGGPVTRLVSEGDPVEPDDVLNVVLPRLRPGTLASDDETPTGPPPDAGTHAQ